MKERTKQILSGIVLVICFFSFLVVTFYVTGEQYKQVEKFCNNEFGVGNWIFNETTGTGSHRWYIGQVWECVKNET